MTNEEYRKKYPIGTRIRFIHKTLDTNKVGAIVGFNCTDRPHIYLPKADKHLKDNYYPVTNCGTKFTWTCSWKDIDSFVTKGQQLEFAFMEK